MLEQILLEQGPKGSIEKLFLSNWLKSELNERRTKLLTHVKCMEVKNRILRGNSLECVNKVWEKTRQWLSSPLLHLYYVFLYENQLKFTE